MFIACGKNDKSINLDRNLSGSELSDSYCIKMVRDYWDCSKGAFYNNQYSTGNYYRRNYSCQGDDRGDLMSLIDFLFNDERIVIDRSKCYYRNYILYIEAHKSNTNPLSYDDHYLTVTF